MWRTKIARHPDNFSLSTPPFGGGNRMDLALSLCLIVKNEEQFLPFCLESAVQIADEIVVVDTGSTDNTVGIAERYGARIFPMNFNFIDFAAARNYAINQSVGSWILMLDADERLEPRDIPRLKTLLRKDKLTGYYLERLNYSTGKTTSDFVVRLFPNRADFRYRGRVHETVDATILKAGGKLLQSDIHLHHAFAETQKHRQAKNQLYLKILLEEIAADPSDTSRLDFLAAEYHQLGMYRDAARIMEDVVRLRPTDARAHLFNGLYHLYFTDEQERARHDFSRALELDPGYEEAARYLAIIQSNSTRNFTG